MDDSIRICIFASRSIELLVPDTQILGNRHANTRTTNNCNRSRRHLEPSRPAWRVIFKVSPHQTLPLRLKRTTGNGDQGKGREDMGAPPGL